MENQDYNPIESHSPSYGRNINSKQMQLNLSSASAVYRGQSVELAPLNRSQHSSVDRFSTNRHIRTSKSPYRHKMGSSVPDYSNKTLNALHPTTKAFIKADRSLTNIYKNIHKANVLFEGVIDSVSTYRQEQGFTLKGILNTYQQMFESMVEKTMHTLNAKDKALKAKEDTLLLKIENLIKNQDDMQERVRAYENRITAKDIEIKTTKNLEGLLKREVAQLREILRYESGALHQDSEKPFIKQKTEAEVKENAIWEAHMRSEELKQADEFDYKLSEDINTIQGIFDELVYEPTNTKRDVLKHLFIELKRILATEVCEQNTQIGEGELFWDVAPKLEFASSAIGNSLYLLIYEGRNEDLAPKLQELQGEEKWQLTPILTKFLANSGAEGRAIPWNHLNTVLNDLLKTRNELNNEILGSQAANFSLDKFCCIYFLKRHQIRRVAEQRMAEFLASLRSYVGKKVKATTFARVLGVNCDIYNNEDFIWQDFVTQQFYLYCQGQVQTEDGWIDIDQATTFIAQFRSWAPIDISKIESMDEGQSLSTDSLLNSLVAYFVAERLKIQETLRERFRTKTYTAEGLFSFEEFVNTIDRQSFVSVALLRAFYMSLMFDENEYSVSEASFMRAMVACGIDSPLPLLFASLDYIIPSQLVKNITDKRPITPTLPKPQTAAVSIAAFDPTIKLKDSVKIPGMRALKTAKYYKSQGEKNLESILVSDRAKLILKLRNNLHSPDAL